MPRGLHRFYKNASIRTKLMTTHLLLIAIPTIVICIFFYSHIYNLVVNDSIRQEQSLSQQTANTLRAATEQITAISTAVRSNPYLAALLQEGREEAAEMVNDPQAARSFYEAVRSQVDGMFVTDIRVYTDSAPDTAAARRMLDEVVSSLSETDGAYWRGIFSGTSKSELFCPSFYLTEDEIEQCGALAYIVRLSRQGAESPSYLAVYFSKEGMTEILKKGISVNDSVSYIINERNSIVAASDTQLSGMYMMDYSTVRQIGLTYSEFTTRTILGEEVYAGCHQIGETDWYVVSVLPAAPILQRGNSIIINFAILYLLLLAAAFIIANWLSGSITRRVEQLGAQMRRVRLGPPVKMADPQINDEIGDLISTYNYMTDKMNLLIEKQEKAAEELRISEIRALQAQINPHFLYNTMEMINWLSQTGKRREVTEAIQALSRFYKLTLSKKDIYGTIASETEHVTLYVQLQNMRYSGRIHFVVDIPEEMEEYRIPRLTFQPVVENAILHGILEKEASEGTIVLTGWIEGEDLVIQISDDGVGIEAEQLAGILTGEEKRSGGTNIGVSNTHRRLQVLYGERYGLRYESAPGEGTTVEIRIPHG
ncbi:MAG: histidine kinase [Eubacteriales bacterium]|nr:histidine kinase [Eubacteriales bacterium]